MANKKVKSKAKRKNLTKPELLKKAKMSSLGSALQSIYHDIINLETTQTCVCTCCNVAMPQMNYSEFVNVVTDLWKNAPQGTKIDMICTSIEYFFKHDFEKFGIESLVKPCMFLDRKTGLCRTYKNRPLSCRAYGLWPKEEYERRVDRFVNAYSEYGLSREDLPLNTQCDKVKRVDESIPLTTEMLNGLFSKLDSLDMKIGEFSELQVEQRENYRTFHDWLLLKVFGEDWLSMLTAFMLKATREQILDQIEALRTAVIQNLSGNLPNIVEKL